MKGLLALRWRWRRDDFEDHLHRWVFAHDAGEIAWAVMMNFPPCGSGVVREMLAASSRAVFE